MSKRVSAEDLLRDLHEEIRSGHDCRIRLCTGPNVPPVSMMTCRVCWQFWRIKQYFRRKERRLGKQLALAFGVVLLLLGGAAHARCPKGLSPAVKKEPGKVTRACQDKEGLWQGLVIVKDGKGNLLSVGKYKAGKPDGVWSLFDGRGHLVGHPLYKDGVLVVSDSMTDAEAGGASAED